MTDIQELKEIIEEVTVEQLNFLDLSDKEIDDSLLSRILPDICELDWLEGLDLSYNYITAIPDDISDLKNLRILKINNEETIPDDNKLIDLAESIGELSQLTELYLGNNTLTKLPESIAKLENLTKLYLSGNQFIKLPDTIGELSQLAFLYLSDNQLATLPDSISKLKNSLTKLYLSGNQFEVLPDVIGKLSQLTSLSLSDNQLRTLPDSLPGLSKLTNIYLSDNHFTKLPDVVCKLPRLSYLDILNNQLTALPENIWEVSNLTYLYISGNQLTEFLKFLVNLLSTNKQWNFPSEDSTLQYLPIEITRPIILAVRDYFRQIREDYLYEAKLLLVGEPGAGKTTLARKLKNEDAPLPERDESTKGIDISTWSFKQEDKPDFKVNVWDFGGQEIYLATHRFFLTRNSLYLLVADSRKDDTYFDYWLSSIELFGDKSPTLIISNEVDDRKRPFNIGQLKGNFSNLISDPIRSNFKTKRGLDIIHSQIKLYIHKLPHIGKALPKTWIKVRQVLENETRNYISQDEFFDLCDEYGFKLIKEKKQLSEYLNFLGVCLHFHDDPLLERIVFLKPQWCIDAAYKVLDNDDVINNKGKFSSQDDLEKIWQGEQRKNLPELLKLMEKFRLCYQVQGEKNTYIAPQLLTEDKPNYDWNNKENLQLRYTYKFMPRGIIWQLIAALHNCIEKPEYAWRSGVILSYKDARVEVIEYYSKKYIHIRIAGNNKQNRMAVICDKFEEIHKTYKRLKAQRSVPCNCSNCKTTSEPHFFELKKLEEMLQNNKTITNCYNPPNYYPVNIIKLIKDVLPYEISNPTNKDESDRQIINNFYLGDQIMKTIYIGDNNTITAPMTIAEYIEKSFNALENSQNINTERKKLLQDLLKEINELNKKELGDKRKEAERMARDAETLVKEIDSGEPRPEFYNMLLKGLKGTAEIIGGAKPILDIVDKLTGYFV